MKNSDLIHTKIDTTGHLIASASYYYYNLNYLINDTTEEGKNLVNSYPILKSIRGSLWSIVVLYLSKILGNRKNDKFSIYNLVNYLIESYDNINWLHEWRKQELEAIINEFQNIQSILNKIKEIRDTQIAHYDNVSLNYTIGINELANVLEFCQKTYNSITYYFEDKTTYWRFSEAELMIPVIDNLNKYSKLRTLFYTNLASMNEKIDISELGKIIK